MRRLVASILLLVTICGLVAAQPAGAQDSAAECFPATGGDYPPSGPAVNIDVDLTLQGGLLDPEVSITVDGRLELSGAEPGATYCGILFSRPVTFAPTVANSAGRLTLTGDIPNDFALNAPHHLDVYRAGQLVGAFDFCVTDKGTIVDLNHASCRGASGKPGKGSLARTGSDWTLGLVQFGALLLVVGAAVLYVRRRRLTA